MMQSQVYVKRLSQDIQPSANSHSSTKERYTIHVPMIIASLSVAIKLGVRQKQKQIQLKTEIKWLIGENARQNVKMTSQRVSRLIL